MNFLDLAYFLINEDLGHFQTYIELVKTPILQWQKETKKEYEKFMTYFTKDEEDKGYEDLLESDAYRHFKLFPHLAYSSLFVSIMAFLEKSLKDICFSFESVDGIQLTDLSGSSIFEKCKKYFKKVLKIDLTDLNAFWSEFTIQYKIRNKIVHEDSNIWSDKNKPLKAQELYDYISKCSSYKFQGRTGNFIIVDDLFLHETLQDIPDFFYLLIEKLKKMEIEKFPVANK